METVEEVQRGVDGRQETVGDFKNVNENLADVEEKICAVFMRGWT